MANGFEHEHENYEDFVRYLAAKTSVDDRALNKDVLDVLRSELAARALARPAVLEIGGGLGTMLARLVDWKVLTCAEYRIVELGRGLVDRARSWLVNWAERRGFTTSVANETLGIRGPGVDLDVTLVCGDVSALDQAAAPGSCDLLIANAVLDMLDVPSALPRILDELVAGGLFWFTINFDGETAFLPEHPADHGLLAVYHRSMDERLRDGRPSGDSKTGRHLFGRIPEAGGTILAAGPSDWIVRAEAGATYPGEERFFLHHILDIIEAELERHADVDRSTLSDWLTERRAQLASGKLVYLAHQLDFLGARAR
jgi:hypothetical protein